MCSLLVTFVYAHMRRAQLRPDRAQRCNASSKSGKDSMMKDPERCDNAGDLGHMTDTMMVSHLQASASE